MKNQILVCSSLIVFVTVGLVSAGLFALGDSTKDSETANSQDRARWVDDFATEFGQRKAVPPPHNVMSGIEMEQAQTSGFSLGSSDVAQIPNPLIDAARFVAAAEESIKLRGSRRLTEEQFIEMSKEKDVIILDARSRDRYDQVHVKGAMSLPFTDISFDSLAQQLPNKEARILIYCNNNFVGNLPEFAEKCASTSLNLSTFATLYEYGYKNVYELGPALQVDQTKIPLEGTNAKMLTTN